MEVALNDNKIYRLQKMINKKEIDLINKYNELIQFSFNQEFCLICKRVISG